MPPDALPLTLDRQNVRPLSVRLADGLRSASRMRWTPKGWWSPRYPIALSRHLRWVRRELLCRRNLLVAALRSTGRAVTDDQAGAHLVMELPGRASSATCCAARWASESCSTGWRAAMTGRQLGTGVTVSYAAPRSQQALTAVLAPLTALLAASPPSAVSPG